MIDVSDGFTLDASRLAEASGVGLRIEIARIPVAAEASLDEALGGGEDYELIATMPADALIAAREAMREAFGVALTDVGVVSERGLLVVGADGRGTRVGAEGMGSVRMTDLRTRCAEGCG